MAQMQRTLIRFPILLIAVLVLIAMAAIAAGTMFGTGVFSKEESTFSISLPSAAQQIDSVSSVPNADARAARLPTFEKMV